MIFEWKSTNTKVKLKVHLGQNLPNLNETAQQLSVPLKIGQNLDPDKILDNQNSLVTACYELNGLNNEH